MRVCTASQFESVKNWYLSVNVANQCLPFSSIKLKVAFVLERPSSLAALVCLEVSLDTTTPPHFNKLATFLHF